VTEHDERPKIRVTDKRRFAREVEGGSDRGASGDRGSAANPTLPHGASTPDPSTPGASTPSPSGEEELEKARAEAREYLEHLQRLQAEFDNYRKRVLKEQTAAIEMAAEPVMRRLLEVLDEFELALLHANEKPDHERFLKGVELVFAKLVDSLRAEGLERIEAEGQPFDPERHEALMQTGHGEGEPIVADVLRPGYTLRGRVIRPAGVRVERK
jgi:molecular chaperone GrpE (heat shock protein)